jgi:hypothetical protein
MPNFDGGHYFLTALIPIRTDPVEDPRAAEWVTSHAHALRETLATMPTALQSWATEGTGLNAPSRATPARISRASPWWTTSPSTAASTRMRSARR